jgi:hypothetical protein
MNTPTPIITPPLTWDEHVAKMHSRGFKWVRSDAVVTSQDVALTATAVLDLFIADYKGTDAPLTEAVLARDALQTAICVAVEAS